MCQRFSEQPVYLYYDLVPSLLLTGSDIDGELFDTQERPDLNDFHLEDFPVESTSKAVPMDAMDTLVMPNDTQAGIECALQLGESLPLDDPLLPPPPLHRTSYKVSKEAEQMEDSVTQVVPTGDAVEPGALEDVVVDSPIPPGQRSPGPDCLPDEAPPVSDVEEKLFKH